ncbi:protein of unknown function DUF324 [Thalassoporum mexicanum PCC 7367]|uniref:RAMP superfamily CRISPR-associated protein n=1 Tax=Thalassoporum mexicanum TaxID=3457544 RepID=UPI00029FCA69|nr:RAMP superfamily CRISPR-associated protein [Pseudanabaena sp. PCC 7367]AFY68748.1 protein of unknown function DUF324 [Pseudanabaena sp. PCC 7367]
MVNLARLIQSDRRTEPITIAATIDTALCIGAGGSSGSLADKPIVRDAMGRFVIPASQIKGRLRHECEKLGRALEWDVCGSPIAQNMCPQRASSPGQSGNYCKICQIFGNPRFPSHVLFDDLICKQDTASLPEFTRPGVTISRKLRTAKDQKLFYLETTPPASELKFEGNINFIPDRPGYAKPLIFAALKHINALGGSKSAGLGWLSWDLSAFQITEADIQELQATEGSSNAAG